MENKDDSLYARIATFLFDEMYKDATDEYLKYHFKLPTENTEFVVLDWFADNLPKTIKQTG